MIEGIELIAVFFGYDRGALARLDHYREAREGDGVGAKMIACRRSVRMGRRRRPGARPSRRSRSRRMRAAT